MKSFVSSVFSTARLPHVPLWRECGSCSKPPLFTCIMAEPLIPRPEEERVPRMSSSATNGIPYCPRMLCDFHAKSPM